MNNKKMLDFQTIAVDFDGTLCYSKWPELGQPNLALIEYLRNGNAMAINSFSGPAAPGKPCRKQSNGAGNRILNLMQLMTIFRKTQRHRTRNGAMPLCLFWHSFLVSAGYLPNTVFLIIKICWLNFFKFCYFIR